MLEAIRFVDLVIPEENWEQKLADVEQYHVDTFVMGDDWTGEFDFLKDVCEVGHTISSRRSPVIRRMARTCLPAPR
ncbi:hypothetical protein GCM10022261_04840 [Brevibacterium daeguense]|uniref:Glycerol-3-phosphate cytidylyltransferase n=2 Tax=Brevibacterium daeguense TaxID=909936 RepID=A0ABP8EGB7_9MICO